MTTASMLCGNVLRSHKCIVDIWVHIDRQILLFNDFVVSRLDHGINPCLKNLTNAGVNDVGYVLSWQNMDGSFFYWKCISYRWPVSSMIQHGLNIEPIKVWNLNRFYIVGSNYLTFSTGKISEMID